jgi:ribokinase
MVATGGLGSGIVLELEGDETIGREESRGAYLLERRDFGKLHIISHYVRVLFGDEFVVVPIGRVGGDDNGRELERELRDVGLDLSHVTVDETLPTLLSVCFAYPSGEGGNLTTLNSASSAVTSEDVESALPVFELFRERGIAVAAPEVPLAARAALLRLATEYGFLRVGSFVSAEVRSGAAAQLLASFDLVSLNRDEAASLGGVPPDAGLESVISSVVDVVRVKYPDLAVVVTAASHGSWAWDGADLTHEAAVRTEVRNAAGAGDAHLAGLITGLSSGVTLAEANAFATLVSALKVGCEDTIGWTIDGTSVEEASQLLGRPIAAPILRRLRPRGAVIGR